MEQVIYILPSSYILFLFATKCQWEHDAGLHGALVWPITLRNMLHMCSRLTLAGLLLFASLLPLSQLLSSVCCPLNVFSQRHYHHPWWAVLWPAAGPFWSQLEVALSNMGAVPSLFSQGLHPPPPPQPCHINQTQYVSPNKDDEKVLLQVSGGWLSCSKRRQVFTKA